MRTLSFQTKVLSGFFVLFFLLVFFGWKMIQFFQETEEDSRQIVHTHEVRETLELVLLTIIDIQSSARGYVITENPEFLGQFEKNIKAIDHQIGTLRMLTSDNPSQQMRIDMLEMLVAKKLEWEKRVVQTLRTEGRAAAASMVASGIGRQRMERIRSLISEMSNEENRLLHERHEEASASASATTWMLYGSLLIMLTLVVVLFVGTQRYRTTMERTNTLLEKRVEERTAKLAASEREFRNLAETALIGIYRTTLKGEIRYVNNALARMMGFDSIAELIRDGAIARYRDPADWQAFIQKLQRDGKVESYESVLLNKSGEPLYALLSAQINGDIITGTILDITERKRAEEALRRNEALLLQTSKMAKIGGWELDLQTMTLTWSLETYRIHEVDPSLKPDLENAINFYAPEARPTITEAVRQAIEEGKAFDLELPFITAKGNRIWVRSMGEAEFQNGKCIRLFGTFQDITERKQAEEALRQTEQRYRSTLDSMLEGVQIIGFDWRYLYINNTAAQHGKKPKEELLGRTMMECYPGIEKTPLFAALQRCMTERATLQMENEFTYPDGEQGRFNLSIQPVPEGLLILSQDITERKRLEEERFAREVAERANQAKSEFLSRMSHELRTPLNSVLGFAQLLEMEDLTPEQKENVRHILKSGSHLLDLINEVLDIARIEAGKMKLSPETVNLKSFLLPVVDIIRPLAAQRGIAINIRIPSSRDIFITADVQRLKQVLLNLLSNAVKYNKDNGKITVVASLLTDGYLLLSVEDTGYGITPENLKKLFTPFERLDSDRSFAVGTGLGLALSKGLIEAMGGRIGAQSEVGKGSTFWITLQLTTEQKEAAVLAEVEEYKATSPVPTRGLILYVEDNLSNIKLVEKILERLPGIQLMTAMQGRLAVELAQQHMPALILLDIHLPDINGIDVLRQLHSTPETTHIPVIMMSADATQTQRNHALNAGAADYITKPINVRQFLDTIGKMLSIT